MATQLAIPKEQVAELCQRRGIARLAIFGSALRDDFRPESDVDILVEFKPGVTHGLSFFAIQDELSDLLGRVVDLNTVGCLSKYFRDEVLAEAEVIYEQA
jgi:uncharacterized protein